jgi:exodeoxyribonuclease VII small subunit
LVIAVAGKMPVSANKWFLILRNTSMADKQRLKKTTAGEEPIIDNSVNPTFESSLSELEKTIELLEKPDVSLDVSLALFEKGVTLIRTCDTHLKKAQGKISELLQGENREFVEKILSSSLESFIAKEDSDG